MTNGQTSGSESPMEGTAENTGGVSGMMNLTINQPDNVRISTVDSDETEESEGASANATGTIVAFAGAVAPNDWLICNGAAVNRATYADLFTVIGTNYGEGDSSTTFNLPDLRGRFALGLDNMGVGNLSANRVTASEADELGDSDGSEKVTLTKSQMPPHKHQSDDHGKILAKTIFGAQAPNSNLNSGNDTVAVEPMVYTSTEGGGQAHDNMPPYLSLNYLIKT